MFECVFVFVSRLFFIHRSCLQNIVAGIDRYPKKVTRAMGKKRLEKRCKVKPFVKTVNFVHLMPTRYSVDMELKKFAEGASAVNTRTDTKKAIKKVFEERYKSQTGKTDKKAGGVQYFFNKLRF